MDLLSKLSPTLDMIELNSFSLFAFPVMKVAKGVELSDSIYYLMEEDEPNPIAFMLKKGELIKP